MDKEGAAFNRWIDRTYGPDDEAVVKLFEKHLAPNLDFGKEVVYQVTQREMLRFAKALLKRYKDKE